MTNSTEKTSLETLDTSDQDAFEKELEKLICKYNWDKSSDTPAALLANYLIRCLWTNRRIIRDRDVSKKTSDHCWDLSKQP